MKLRAGAACLLAALAVLGQARADPGDAELQHSLDRIRTAPLEADGFGDLAGWLFRRGDLVRARDAAREAARLEVDSAHYQRLLGYIAAAAGASEEAEHAFQRAAELDPASRTSLADFHLARAWLGYQDALRRNGPDRTLLERLREVAAAMEINPEMKAMLRGGWPEELPPARASGPPIYLGPGVATALVVEKRTQTVRLYGRGPEGVALLKTYPCTTGQAEGAKQERGDLKTPDGVYFFSALIPSERLPNQYGALALPLSYPNAWDRRSGRGGHGIWFHGSDRVGSPFTPRDTQGCILMRNEDLLELAGLVTPLVTPILIAEEVPDRPAAEWQATLQALGRSGGVPADGIVAGPDYTLLLRREGKGVTYDFVSGAGATRFNLEETLAGAIPGAWEEKLRALQPQYVAALVHVGVSAVENRVIIETSAPVHARTFRPELAQRLYLDLPGVRSGPTPESYAGGGLVARVRVSCAPVEPPITRVVIDLDAETTYRMETIENRIVVSFGEREAASARRPSGLDRPAAGAHDRCERGVC